MDQCLDDTLFLIFNPLNIVYKPRRYEQSRSRRNESIERSKRLPRKLDYGFQFETFSFPESRRKILTGSRSRREQNLVSNRERCRTKTPWKHDLRRSYNTTPPPSTGVIKMGRCHCAPRRKVRLIINVSLASVKSFPPQIWESFCVSAIVVFLDSSVSSFFFLSSPFLRYF